ncbi:MAG: hypothetical protein OXT09_05725 [Myxococcales bacterium]|nr:hypothetical protein [Myxococcales bacterium]
MWPGPRPREDAHTDDDRLYSHAKRPEWGLAIAEEELADRTIYLFQTGERRTIMNEFGHLMSEAAPSEEEAAEARKYFSKRSSRGAGSGAAKKKATKRTTKKKAAKAKAKSDAEAKPS